MQGGRQGALLAAAPILLSCTPLALTFPMALPCPPALSSPCCRPQALLPLPWLPPGRAAALPPSGGRDLPHLRSSTNSICHVEAGGCCPPGLGTTASAAGRGALLPALRSPGTARGTKEGAFPSRAAQPGTSRNRVPGGSRALQPGAGPFPKPTRLFESHRGGRGRARWPPPAAAALPRLTSRPDPRRPRAAALAPWHQPRSDPGSCSQGTSPPGSFGQREVALGTAAVIVF